MDTKNQLQEAYYHYILQNGEQPKTVHLFAQNNQLTEEEFYDHFGSFESIEQAIWLSFFEEVIKEVKNQEVWHQYSSREKALSFFYSLVEFLKPKRSFAAFSLKNTRNALEIKRLLHPVKAIFDAFSAEIMQEGLESGELMDRPFVASRYKDALWLQLAFVLDFWAKDPSARFEKTDEAIEKGVNVLFNFFQRSPIDDLIDYVKFLSRNSGSKNPF